MCSYHHGHPLPDDLATQYRLTGYRIDRSPMIREPRFLHVHASCSTKSTFAFHFGTTALRCGSDWCGRVSLGNLYNEIRRLLARFFLSACILREPIGRQGSVRGPVTWLAAEMDGANAARSGVREDGKCSTKSKVQSWQCSRPKCEGNYPIFGVRMGLFFSLAMFCLWPSSGLGELTGLHIAT
jgi:hypothetical protein